MDTFAINEIMIRHNELKNPPPLPKEQHPKGKITFVRLKNHLKDYHPGEGLCAWWKIYRKWSDTGLLECECQEDYGEEYYE